MNPKRPDLLFSVLFTLMLLCVFLEESILASTSLGEPNTMIRIESLAEISDLQPAGTFYFFDIDDTLIDSPYMLGSKAWRKYMSEVTKRETICNWHDLFSLYVALNHPLNTVESITAPFIKELQEKGYVVFGLTARERKKWYDTPAEDIDLLTANQLRSLGIVFKTDNLDSIYDYLIHSPEHFQGIFFADIEPKGGYLLKLFKEARKLPRKVIFIDDKQSQVESVAEALDELGIDNECYWYCPTDKKNQDFDPLVANIQLYYFWTSRAEHILSDSMARAIAQKNPDKAAEYYLQHLLEQAKPKFLINLNQYKVINKLRSYV